MSAQILDTIETTGVATMPAQSLRSALTACLLSAEKGKMTTLPILAAVRLERTGTSLTLTATDRYRLTRVTATVADGPDWSFTLTAADAARVIALIPRKDAGPMDLTLEATDGVLSVTDWGGSSVHLTEIEGEYPRVQSVIDQAGKDVEAVEEIAVNPRYLADLAKMPGLGLAVKFQFHGAARMVTATWTDEVSALQYLYLLMPCR